MTNTKTEIPTIERAIIDSERFFEHDLQFYEEPPKGLMDVEDLEKLVTDRLAILGMVKEVAATSKGKSAKRCRKRLIKKLRKGGFELFADLCEGTGYRQFHTDERYAARRRDHVSHYILLLSMSQSIHTREWIEETEGFLFEWRLSALDHDGIDIFITINNLRYYTLTENEKKLLSRSLKRDMKHPSSFDSTAFYKIPALDMLYSVQKRWTYLKDGIAYPTNSQLCSPILGQYKDRLRSRIKKLIGAHRYMIDPRIHIVIDTVRKMFKSVKAVIWSTGVTSVDKLDELAATSYPPCMRRLHEGLRTTHHLRNQGRVQYTLFLKAIGIQPDDAIEFYRNEFTKEITNAAFNKEYVYVIRHLYGLVGSKKSHDVYSCSKMVTDRPRPNEYHGCPFASHDIEDLGKMLTGWNINSSSKDEIIDLATKKDCENACAGYFKAIHEPTGVYPITNPKDFYGQSIKLRTGDDFMPPVVPAKADDDETDESKSSDESEISDEYDDSDDDCRVTEENTVPLAKRKKLTPVEREAKMSRELVEFYKKRRERNAPIRLDKISLGSITFADLEFIDIEKQLSAGSTNLGTVSSNDVYEQSYVDYIYDYFMDPESEKDED